MLCYGPATARQFSSHSLPGFLSVDPRCTNPTLTDMESLGGRLNHQHPQSRGLACGRHPRPSLEVPLDNRKSRSYIGIVKTTGFL